MLSSQPSLVWIIVNMCLGVMLTYVLTEVQSLLNVNCKNTTVLTMCPLSESSNQTKCFGVQGYFKTVFTDVAFIFYSLSVLFKKSAQQQSPRFSLKVI